MGRRRTIVVIVAVAVGSLVVGFVLAGQIQSPREAAARAAAPDASHVTVPVEERELENRVVTRGDAVFSGAVDVEVEVASLETPAVVTGHVPAAGDSIEEGAPALEVVGRPVIALTGDLPTYRTLSPGLRGPDVEQLEAALERLGIDPGDASDGRYDLATSAAVAELFRRAGHEPPAIPEQVQLELEAAEDAVDAAQEGLDAARAALAAAAAGPPESARIAAEAQVEDARHALEQARQDEDEAAVRSAETQLRVAEASLAELLAPQDTAGAQAAVARAQQDLDEARQDHAEIAATAGTPLPAAEVVFLPTLPRRVDEVTVARGAVIDGPVMRVSGADLVVVATLASGDRDLVEAGMAATLEAGDRAVEGEVTEISERASGGYEAVITPVGLDADAIEDLRGANLKVTIPIEATDGAVLVVPLAALTAGPDGESRVEVLGGDAETTLVTVEVGLAADGYAEVTAVDDELEVGDDVVVGQ